MREISDWPPNDGDVLQGQCNLMLIIAVEDCPALLRKTKKGLHFRGPQTSKAETGPISLEISSLQKLDALVLPFPDLYMDVMTEVWSSPGAVKIHGGTS